MFVRIIFYQILMLVLIIEFAFCVPAGSNRQNVPKIKQIVGKSIQGAKIVSDKNVPTKKEVNTTAEPSLDFTKGFSWSSMEDIVRQVIVASNAVDHLEKMKTKLLSQFDKKTGEFATARGGYGGYGAYGFPSLEGALLSIAFLTFAVFLIDLIQQLLSRFRTGTAGVVPLVGRRRRSLVPEDEYDPLMGLTNSVLNSIDSPVFKM
ncbi:unnamed protein product [Allacma fusca]|uniref:Uncharacterized protein n=1 Tax=Allacma fusca TaxID=39272 RepID=A0A8J2JLD6_9HEXA|nr:unnamed protein product [Allacma fusca]